MNGLIVALSAVLAVANAAPSGHLGGAVVTGPAGVVTSHGAVGTVALGLGLGHGGAVLTAPSATAVVSGPAHGAIIAPAHGAVIAPGLAHGAVIAPGLAHGAAVVAPGAVIAGPAVVGHGLGAITPGGGAIGVSAHGAAIRGPPTAPVVVAGPSGKVAADGLWGPTANIGLSGHLGHH